MMNGESTVRTRRQDKDDSPYEIIYLTPQQLVPSQVFSTPDLNKIRAIYPLGSENCPINSSSIPQYVYHPSAASNTNLVQYISDSNSIRQPQSTYMSTAAQPTLSLAPSRPVYKLNRPPIHRTIPTCIHQPTVYVTTAKPITAQCHYCSPSVTQKPNIIPTTCSPILPPSNPQPTSSPSISVTFPSTSECSPDVTVPSIKPVLLSQATPNATCNETGRSGFCIDKAFIFLGFNPKSIAALKNSVKNVQSDDDFEILQDTGNCTSNPSIETRNNANVLADLKQNYGFCIKHAVVTVKEEPHDQSKLIHLIEDLIKELKKPRKNSAWEDGDYVDDDDEQEPGDYDDEDCDGIDVTGLNFENIAEPETESNDHGIEPSGQECVTELDLIDACKNLTETISTLQIPQQESP